VALVTVVRVVMAVTLVTAARVVMAARLVTGNSISEHHLIMQAVN